MKNLKFSLIACCLMATCYSYAQTSASVDMIKRVPVPMPKVAGQSGGRISAETLRQAKGIEIAFEDTTIKSMKYDVTGFEMIYIPSRQDGMGTKTTGAFFNDKMKGFLEQAKPGDVYYFDLITVMGPDSVQLKLPDITFKVE